MGWKKKQSNNSSVNLDKLSDVDTTTVAPVNGYVLAYNSVTGQWEPKQNSGTISTSDVDGGSFSGVDDGIIHDGGTF